MDWDDASRWQFGVVGLMNGVSWVLDPNGKALFANERVLQTLGRQADEVVGADWFGLAVPEDIRDGVRAAYGRLVERGAALSTPFDSALVTAAGEQRVVRVFSAVLRDDEGRVQAVAVAGEDVTESRRAFAAMEASEERYRTLAEASQDMVFIIDPEDRVQYVNSNAAHHLGCSAESVTGRPRSEFFPGADSPRQYAALQRVLATGETLRSETQNDVGGRTVWLDTHLVPLRDRDGAVTSVMGVARDITDRKRAEDAERLAALGQLAAGVGHEFNNILASLALAAEVALMDHAGTPCEELARYVLRASMQGAEVCNQLAAFARPSTPRREACTLEEALEAALGVVRNQLAQSGVSVKRDYVTTSLTVEVDRAQIQQVFVNLFINAIHAMPGGGVLTLSTRHIEGADGGSGEMCATVSDTGTGIAPEHLGRVFEPFYTTKGALSDNGQPGTGLGLSVSHSIVTKHGGRLGVRSQPGRGASFEVVLPVQGTPSPAAAGAPASTAAPAQAGARILVAEDGPDLCQYICVILGTAGYEVVPVSGTAEALAALREGSFDLVLTDLLMPGGGGQAVMQQALQCPVAPPVIAMSGRVSEDIEQAAFAAGAHSFVRKPFSRSELLRAVSEALAAGSGAPQPPCPPESP